MWLVGALDDATRRVGVLSLVVSAGMPVSRQWKTFLFCTAPDLRGASTRGGDATADPFGRVEEERKHQSLGQGENTFQPWREDDSPYNFLG